MKLKTLLIGLMALVISLQTFATTEMKYYPTGEVKAAGEFVDGVRLDVGDYTTHLEKKEMTSPDKLKSYFKNFIEVLLLGLFLASIYWLIGWVIKALLEIEIRSSNGYGVVIVLGGYLLQQILISVIKSTL